MHLDLIEDEGTAVLSIQGQLTDKDIEVLTIGLPSLTGKKTLVIDLLEAKADVHTEKLSEMKKGHAESDARYFVVSEDATISDGSDLIEVLNANGILDSESWAKIVSLNQKTKYLLREEKRMFDEINESSQKILGEAKLQDLEAGLKDQMMRQKFNEMKAAGEEVPSLTDAHGNAVNLNPDDYISSTQFERKRNLLVAENIDTHFNWLTLAKAVMDKWNEKIDFMMKFRQETPKASDELPEILKNYELLKSKIIENTGGTVE